jgi:hypothetical protein
LFSAFRQADRLIERSPVRAGAQLERASFADTTREPATNSKITGLKLKAFAIFLAAKTETAGAGNKDAYQILSNKCALCPMTGCTALDRVTFLRRDHARTRGADNPSNVVQI